eukprot:Nitzschia sp. Nitz4//scaffold3_size479765//222483//224858//NITZ4_000095-RA/size479765-processed-gene-1.510-mRNA-1//-1//CDS//3329550743//8982//frame0
MANESEKEGAWGAAPGPSSAVGPPSGGFGTGQMRPASMPPGFMGGNLAQSEQKDQELFWTSQADGSRTDELAASSFTDIAAALGSGLAESMDDATRGEHTKTVLTENFLFKDQEDISYARHNRHAASRLLGAGQAQDAFGSHKAQEAGSLFSAFDSSEGVGGRAPGPAPAMFDYSKDPSNGSSHGGTLSSAFTPGPSDGVRGFQSKSSFDASKLTIPKELGTTVVEPDSYGRANDGTYELQRDMQNLWSNRDSQHDSRKSPQGASQMGEQPKAYQQPAEDELRPFTWDVRHQDASRALAIMRAGSLSASDVRSICESYGMIESFRSDFVDKGVFFVSYYDMRSAQYAAPDLQMRLQSLGPSAERVLVQYCVPLNSSSQLDESLVVLVGVPADMNIEMLAAMLGSYGAVRSLRSMGGNYGGNSFVVEYHDVQDAKQAALELESTQQFGPSVTVEVGARNPADRQRGRELLALLGRWRHGGGGNAGGSRQPRQTSPHVHASEGPRYDMGPPAGRDHGAQLVLGPDGRYSYMVVNHVGYPPGGGMGGPYGDRVMHSGHGTTYVNHVSPANHHQYWQPQTHHFSSNGSVVSQSSYPDSHSGHYPSGTQSLPYYRGDGNSSVGSHSNRMSVPGPSSASSAGGGGGDTQHLILDLDAVENGRDTRTSLMVRNIPNKYTQQMLLSEFTENGHGPGVIDFFYLPIDFKNRCNRGYAFINFVDYRDILAFHRRYFGKHWRTFNSDKICDITYARIQGKSAMLKRFENSALMEKDDEYKPLVFASSGAEKGTRLPFPNPNK